MFARDCLQGAMGKDVLYDTMNREDLNWRKYHEQVARKTVQTFKRYGKRAYDVDDSVAQAAFWQKDAGAIEPFRSYFRAASDGTTSADSGPKLRGRLCAPLDSELFISQTKAIALYEPFADGRSIAAKRYKIAQQCTQPGMVKSMIRRALNAGLLADYLLADAWFGTKAMIRLTQDTALVPVLRMKKNTMKYRIRSLFVASQ
jgi:hypothetical protein